MPWITFEQFWRLRQRATDGVESFSGLVV